MWHVACRLLSFTKADGRELSNGTWYMPQHMSIHMSIHTATGVCGCLQEGLPYHGSMAIKGSRFVLRWLCGPVAPTGGRNTQYNAQTGSYPVQWADWVVPSTMGRLGSNLRHLCCHSATQTAKQPTNNQTVHPTRPHREYPTSVPVLKMLRTKKMAMEIGDNNLAQNVFLVGLGGLHLLFDR